MTESSWQHLQEFPNYDSAQALEIVNARDLDEVSFRREFVDKNKPCLVKGAVAHWPAVERWQSKQYLSTLCGERRTKIFKHISYIATERMRDGIPSTMSEFFEQAFSDTSDYLCIPVAIIKKGSPVENLGRDISGF